MSTVVRTASAKAPSARVTTRNDGEIVIGDRDARELGLTASDSRADNAAVQAGPQSAVAAVGAHATRQKERHDDEVAGLDDTNVSANLNNLADELVTDLCAVFTSVFTAKTLQV